MGNFRLVIDESRTSETATAGRFEYFVNDAWGTMCDDYADRNNNAAEVICKTLQLPWTEASHYNKFGASTSRTWLDNVICSGDERNIMECRMNGIGDVNCRHQDDFHVICAGTYGEGLDPTFLPPGFSMGNFDIYNSTTDAFLGTVDIRS